MIRHSSQKRRINITLDFILLALLSSVLLWGCGQKIGGPTETSRGIAPPPNTYVLTYEWQNFPGTTDIVVTIGGFVYVAQESARVAGYKTFSPERHPLISDLEGLVKPIIIAEGVDEEIYVADMGDTTVKRFSRSGGAPIQVLRDTAWTNFGGIAADDKGFVYVADRVKEFIWKYAPSGERDTTFGMHDGVLTEGGEGEGYVRQPGGLSFDGIHLQVTDIGKNRVQKLVTDERARAALRPPVVYTEEDTLTGEIYVRTPLDSDADFEGNIYVTYAEINRALKYDNSGSLLATVNWDTTQVVGTLPAVAARDRWVYVADPEHSRILIYELR